MWAVLPIILALAGLAALLYFGMGSYKAIMWWLLLSPDYLLFLGLTWVYTLDYVSWQGMAKLGQYAWTIDAMLLVGVVYFILNSVLYGIHPPVQDCQRPGDLGVQPVHHAGAGYGLR